MLIESAAHSPDLTVPDFCIWNYVKCLAYSPTPKNLYKLKKNICSAFGFITSDMLLRAFQNLLIRINTCVYEEEKRNIFI